MIQLQDVQVLPFSLSHTSSDMRIGRDAYLEGVARKMGTRALSFILSPARTSSELLKFGIPASLDQFLFPVFISLSVACWNFALYEQSCVLGKLVN